MSDERKFWPDIWLPFLFNCHSEISAHVPADILNPYAGAEVREICRAFYEKYYSDSHSRTLIFGINPGRLGAGTTGISFTDPVKLQNECSIPNSFNKKEELSSRYIYSWIKRQYSIEEFYRKFIILSVCPLGFIENGKNINYYDRADLRVNVENLIVSQQVLIRDAHVDLSKVFIFGKGKNYKYFKTLNERYRWYDTVVPLPHPRWIMQYRYKKRHELMEDMHRRLTLKYT